MGKGPVPSDIMIIGEVPGFREDETGNPLEGKAKVLLYQFLKEFGIDPKDCYFTNVVKCRTPDLRSPNKEEIKACKQYLDKEFEHVKPKYVMVMGAAAMKAVLNKAKITEVHGQVFEKDGIKYMPVFHPAMAIRDPKKLDPVRLDIERFSQLVKGTINDNQYELNLTVIKNFEDFNEMIQEISKARAVSFDIETNSLNRYDPDGKINCLGLAIKDRQWVLPLNLGLVSWRNQKEVQQQMIDLICMALKRKIYRYKGSKKIKVRREIIAHNGKFDNLWIKVHYRKFFPLTFDTMLAAYILDENSPNSLKYLARAILRAPDYDIDTETKKGQQEAQKNPMKLFYYNGYDVLYTLKLYEYFKKQLEKDEALNKVFRHLLMPASRAFQRIEYTGVYVHQDRFKKVEEELKGKLAEVQKKLDFYVPGVNWSSTKQVADVLFNKLKLPIIETTKSGNPATGESILKRLLGKHPIIELLLEYREVKQSISHFVDGWKSRMVHGKLYPSFKLHGTVTGRLSCVDPNLQQVPRDKTIRSLIGAPPGWTFVQADYSQVELRIAAMLSGDPTMKLVFQTGEDIHTKTAQVLTGKDKPEKEERKKAKPVNFGFLYGMGAPKFVEYARDNYGVIISLEEAKKFRKRFFDTYNMLPAWHDKQRKIVRANGRVRTMVGRLRRLPEVWSPDEKLAAEAERQAINTPVQSFASDITLMAIIELDKKMPRSKFRIVGAVHDAILFMVRNDYLNKALPIIKKTMESPRLLTEVFNINMTVPIVAEIEVGDWGNGVEWKGEKVKV